MAALLTKNCAYIITTLDLQFLTAGYASCIGHIYIAIIYNAFQRQFECPHKRVSLNTGLDSPLECGTGMWDWIIEMDCGTGIWDCNSILAPEPVPMLA